MWNERSPSWEKERRREGGGREGRGTSMHGRCHTENISFIARIQWRREEEERRDNWPYWDYFSLILRLLEQERGGGQYEDDRNEDSKERKEENGMIPSPHPSKWREWRKIEEGLKRKMGITCDVWDNEKGKDIWEDHWKEREEEWRRRRLLSKE